jgi:hypothetical protein
MMVRQREKKKSRGKEHSPDHYIFHVGMSHNDTGLKHANHQGEIDTDWDGLFGRHKLPGMYCILS